VVDALKANLSALEPAVAADRPVEITDVDPSGSVISDAAGESDG